METKATPYEPPKVEDIDDGEGPVLTSPAITPV